MGNKIKRSHAFNAYDIIHGFNQGTFLMMSWNRLFYNILKTNFHRKSGCFFLDSELKTLLTLDWLMVSLSHKQFIVSSILPKMRVGMILCTENYPNLRFFGRIEDTIICFRDCLAFKNTVAGTIGHFCYFVTYGL